MTWLLIGKNGMLGSVFALRETTVPIDLKCVDIDEIDVTNRSSVEDTFARIKPSCVINCSAYTNVDGAETDKTTCEAVNVHGVKNIAEQCKKYGSILVHYSTDFVFDGEKDGLYNEDDLTNPLNYYGLTKLDGEKEVQSILPLNQYLILRTSWLFGPRGNNFVSKIISLAKEHPKLRIVDDQTGNPTYTKDLANATIYLLSKSARGLFHVSNSGGCSWYEFARFAIDVYGIKEYVTEKMCSSELNRPAVRPKNSRMNIDKLEKQTGFVMRNWHDVVKEYVQQYLISN